MRVFSSMSKTEQQIILLIDYNENLTKIQEFQTHLVSAPLFLTHPIRDKYHTTVYFL